MNKDTLEKAKKLVQQIDHCTKILDVLAELKGKDNRSLTAVLTYRVLTDHNKVIDRVDNYAFALPESVCVELERVTRHSLSTYESELLAL